MYKTMPSVIAGAVGVLMLTAAASAAEPWRGTDPMGSSALARMAPPPLIAVDDDDDDDDQQRHLVRPRYQADRYPHWYAPGRFSNADDDDDDDDDCRCYRSPRHRVQDDDDD